jgi:hypothetical protein
MRNDNSVACSFVMEQDTTGILSSDKAVISKSEANCLDAYFMSTVWIYYALSTHFIESWNSKALEKMLENNEMYRIDYTEY